MKIELEQNTYKFLDDDGKLIYRFIFSLYPNCCLSGIISTFGMGRRDEFNTYKKEIQNHLFVIMESYSINQLLINDVRDGYGYDLVKDMENCTPLSVRFNNNSGNFVYLFEIYKDFEG